MNTISDLMTLQQWVDGHLPDLNAVWEFYPSFTLEELLAVLLTQGLRFEKDITELMEAGHDDE